MKQDKLNRIAIFSFYDSEGIVYDYVEYYLNELKKNVARLVIVINGKILENGEKKLGVFTNEIIVRKNVGYDAGAYKECIINYIGIDNISKYDELVLCNDTCFGPFIGFDQIFKKMQNNLCDFWGIKKIERNCFSHLQSYFLVFRKKILLDNSFYNYWREYIDEKTETINDVYATFEQGIYRMLTLKGYVSNCYGNSGNIDNYNSCYYCLEKGDVFIKKKCVNIKEKCDADLALALNLIKHKYSYNTQFIIDFALKKYDEKILLNKVYQKPKCIYYDMLNINEKQLIDFCLKYKKIYIYGCGVYAYNVYHLCRYYNIKISGIYVSNLNEQNVNEIHGIKIREWKNSLNDKEGLIIALNKKNSCDLKKHIKYVNDYLWLWHI